MKSRFLYTIISFVIAIIILFIAIPISVAKTYPKTYAVVAEEVINSGQQITENNVSVQKIGSLNIPDVISDIDFAVGKFAESKIYSGDFITEEKLRVVSDDVAERLLKPNYSAEIINLHFADENSKNILKVGDVIKISSFDKGFIDIPQLSFVRVLSVISKGKGEFITTVAVNEKQKDAISEYTENLYCSVIVRENEELAEKLLIQQEEYFNNEQ